MLNSIIFFYKRGPNPDNDVEYYLVWFWNLNQIMYNLIKALILANGLRRKFMIFVHHYGLLLSQVVNYYCIEFITNNDCVTVDALCWEIHATTKDLPSLRKNEMLIMFVAFCHQLSSLKSCRLFEFDYTKIIS